MATKTTTLKPVTTVKASTLPEQIVVTKRDPRASSRLCSAVTRSFYEAAKESGKMAADVSCTAGAPYSARAGKPDGERVQMCIAAQAFLKDGPKPWGLLQDVKFSYTKRDGSIADGKVSSHLSFLLGNNTILI